MDNQAYLNQISASNRPAKKSKLAGILSSKFFLVGVIFLVVLILIMVVGSALTGGKTSSKDTIFSLILHTNNTSEVIEEYQPKVKSSDLRSYSASLNSVLSDINNKLTDFAVAKYNFKEKEVKKDITEKESAAKDALESDLFEAKINGILDRVYAHKMAYEISSIMTSEAQIIKSIKDEDMTDSLNKSYSSLQTLYDKFNDFSETK